MSDNRSGYSDGVLRYPVSVVDHKKTLEDPQLEQIQEVIPAEATPENQLADKQYVDAKEQTIVDVESGTTTLSANVGNYYNIAGSVGTLSIALPTITGATTVSGLALSFTTDSTTNVTFSAGGSATIAYSSGYQIEGGKSYELECKWNGEKWLVTYNTFS